MAISDKLQWCKRSEVVAVFYIVCVGLFGILNIKFPGEIRTAGHNKYRIAGLWIVALFVFLSCMAKIAAKHLEAGYDAGLFHWSPGGERKFYRRAIPHCLAFVAACVNWFLCYLQLFALNPHLGVIYTQVYYCGLTASLFMIMATVLELFKYVPNLPNQTEQPVAVQEIEMGGGATGGGVRD